MADKYLQENLDEIQYILESTGDKKTAMESVPIVKSTWSKWIKEHPEFKVIVEESIAFWKRNDSDKIIHKYKKIRDELLSKDGSVTKIIDTQALTKAGDPVPIHTVEKDRAPPWLMKDLSETGKEEKKQGDMILNFHFLEEAVAKKAKDE